MNEVITNELVDMEAINNEQLARRYNAIKNFISKQKRNKDIILENGCLGNLIKEVSYVYSALNFSFKEQILIRTDNYLYEIESFKEIRIDRKHSTLQLGKYLNYYLS